MKELINRDNVPQHIAIIMDGNGRWAKKKGAERVFGHKNAIKSVRETAESCAELGVKYVTLYSFSTENWNRPQKEVNALMSLLVSTIKGEINTLLKNNIKLLTIGDISKLPTKAQQELADGMDKTKDNTGLRLILALNYSGKWDLTQATKQIAKLVEEKAMKIEEINQSAIDKYLSTTGIPDPELMVRTSGEMRISNFMLWQLAYSELFITDVLWPDFRKEHLYDAVLSYQKRERRFGKTSEQV